VRNLFKTAKFHCNLQSTISNLQFENPWTKKMTNKANFKNLKIAATPLFLMPSANCLMLDSAKNKANQSQFFLKTED